MSIFISYSTKDAEFVERLSTSLIENNIKVWKDNHKIVIGDSLLNKIQAGIEGASYFCIVLSKNSLESDWVKTEMNYALRDESQKRGMMIIPIMIDDCKIPPFLSDIKAVDFRKDFTAGLNQILAVVQDKYNIGDSGRIGTDSDYFFDYGIEQKMIAGNYCMQIDVVSFDKEEAFSILSQFKFYGNELATREHFDLKEDESMRDYILKACAEAFSTNPARVLINTKDAKEAKFQIQDSEGVDCFKAEARIKWLGAGSRDTLLFNVGALFVQICKDCGICLSDDNSVVYEDNVVSYDA